MDIYATNRHLFELVTYCIQYQTKRQAKFVIRIKPVVFCLRSMTCRIVWMNFLRESSE